MSPSAEPTAGAGVRPDGRLRSFRRHVLRALADHRIRRHLLLVLLSILLIGTVAAAKGAVGYYFITRPSTQIEIGLALAAVVAATFALCQQRIEHALARRFSRTTKEHRDQLTALADEIEVLNDRERIAFILVERFDHLFGTEGAALYLSRTGTGFERAGGVSGAMPEVIDDHDPLIATLRRSHAPASPEDLGSSLPSPLVWPLRARGQLIGILVAGTHEYIESFEPVEVEAVSVLAETVAATLALINPALIDAARRDEATDG